VKQGHWVKVTKAQRQSWRLARDAAEALLGKTVEAVSGKPVVGYVWIGTVQGVLGHGVEPANLFMTGPLEGEEVHILPSDRCPRTKWVLNAVWETEEEP
jgi:YD repeat-containing protein